MKKKIFLLLLLLITTVALFHNEIFFACVKWQTGSYCKKAFGALFSCESLSWEEGKIVAKGGKLVNPGHFSSSFSEACLDPLFDWRHLTIGGVLTLKDLVISHQKKSTSLSSSSNHFLNIELKTEVKNGTIILDETFHFDLSHTIKGSQVFGSVSLKGKGADPLIADFEKTNEGYFKLTPQFHSHSFPELTNLAAHFFQNAFPEVIKHWHFSQGKIDGNLNLLFLNGEVQEMKGHLALNNLRGENSVLGLFSEIDCVEVLLDLDFRSVSTMNGEFILQGGRCALKENGKFGDLNHVQSKICLKEGKLETSSLKGSFLGMEGEALLDWQSTENLLSMKFHGASKEIGILFPESLREKFSNAFPDDYFFLEALLKRSGEGLQLDGCLSIKASEPQTYHANFGCTLGKSPEKNLELIPNLPFSLSRSVDQFLENLTHQFCLSNKRFGWIKGEGFPLEKFFAPFFLHNLQMKTLGKIDFEGTFDERYLVVFYEGEQFSLESPFFSLKTDHIKEGVSSEVTPVHYIDLDTWEHVGFLPLKGSTYHQKNHNFLLSDVDTIIHFENNKIHVQEITAHFKELCLKGDVEIEIKSIVDVDMDIHARHISGRASDAQELLKHFVSSPFLDYPIDGQVESLSEALFFRYHFHPTAQLVSGNVQGSLIDCKMTNPLFQVEAINATLFYDLAQNRFQIQSGNGEIKAPFINKEYSLVAPSIVFSHFPDFQVTFQLDLFEKTGESINLSGRTFSVEGGREIVCEGLSSKNQEKLFLRALQQGKNIDLSELSFGLWKGEGSLFFDKPHLVIDNFGWWSKEKEGFRFSGAYDRHSQKLKGEVSSFKLNLASFKEIPLSLNPNGNLSGFGRIDWSREDGLRASCKTFSHELALGEVQFASKEELTCSYSTQKGLSVEGLVIEIPLGDEVEHYKLGRLSYDFSEKKIFAQKLAFSILPEKLHEATKILSNKIEPTALKWIEKLKANDSLEGALSLEISPTALSATLSLKDGLYVLGNQQLRLKNIFLTYDPVELNIWAKCCNQAKPYWMHFAGEDMARGPGRLVISEQELSCEKEDGYDALVARWEKGFCITSVEGSLEGLEVALISTDKRSDQVCLGGRVSFDPALLAMKWDKLASYSLGGFCTFEGDWVFSKANLTDSKFSGLFSANNLRIYGATFDLCTADCHYEPGLFECSNFAIKDWAGHICINQATIKQEEERWSFAINQLLIDEFRLSRLKSPWTQWNAKEKPFYSSFFIRSFLLNNFYMRLGEMESVRGEGELDFTNLPKKTLFSNLLLLPTEITARIGLDLTSLIPVKGTISYNIDNKKIHLKKFHQMYSDGKHSRFYLAKGAPAYIDFQGNLNMKVKMKQYNLLMKIAELFTVNVKGSLLAPTYTFSTQLETDEIVDTN